MWSFSNTIDQRYLGNLFVYYDTIEVISAVFTEKNRMLSGKQLYFKYKLFGFRTRLNAATMLALQD